MFSSCLRICVSVCSGYNFWRSWHRNFILILLPWHQFNLVHLSEVKVIHEVMVITKVKVIPRSNCKRLTFYQHAGGGPSTERHFCCNCRPTGIEITWVLNLLPVYLKNSPVLFFPIVNDISPAEYKWWRPNKYSLFICDALTGAFCIRRSRGHALY